STRCRRAVSPAHARSRYADRSAASSICSTAMNRSRSFIGRSFRRSSPFRARTARGERKEYSDNWKIGPDGSASASLALQLLEEPGTGVGPKQVGRAGRDTQDLGRLVAGQAGKKAEFDQFRGLGVGTGQLVQ